MNYITAEKPECVLYGKATTGKIKVWKITVHPQWVRETEEGNLLFDQQPNAKGAVEAAIIVMSHGYEDGDEHVDNIRPVLEGKNLGKSNSTTAVEQAFLEANARVSKKMDQGYRLTKKELEDLPVGPMLAYSYEKRKHNLEFPCYVQPKLDGVRCLAHKVDTDKIEFRSRKGKLLQNFEHIARELNKVLEIGEVWDGELYVHGWSFQRIVSAVKAENEDTSKLEYHVYDMVSEISPFDMRMAHVLEKHAQINPSYDGPDWPQYVRVVNTGTMEDERGIYAKLDTYVEEGYEGLIARDYYGIYAVGQRSPSLLKLKPMQDAEYEIVDVKKDIRGAAIFICDAGNGQTFDPVPVGTIEERRQWAETPENFIGKQLTVKYHHLSEDGIPVPNPVGLSVRDYE